MAKVKGTALMPRIKYLEEKATPEQKEKIVALLSPEFQKEVRQGIFLGTWYPFEYYIEINRALDKVLGTGDLSLIPKLGYYSADQGLKGVYKLFYKVGSPEFIIQRGAKVWNQYFVNGQLNVAKVAPGEARITLTEVESPTEEHCLSVLGWVHRTLELSGGKNVRTEMSKCRRKGAPFCEITARWD
ncbi:MAG: hypothetical protein AB1439_05530 [candidate division FCPU426 bacterium]